ncbi:MAG: FKBP-type peptidyl-prolyl cis-trans isomerase [Acidimicrobiia bacterium]|nr:FKBP-type peptidyl-prolyl cis-trans isomerase [Acidimicrobiia bacterium]
MRRLAIPMIAAVLIVAGCNGADEETTTAANGDTGQETTSPGQDVLVAQNGDSATVHYIGTLDDGSQFDSSRDRGEPLTFVVGSDQVIRGFDDAVRGMAIGDVTTVRIPPAEAYGEVDTELIFSVPIEEAPEDVAVGDEVLIGGVTTGRVTNVTEAEVEIDTNHPFAGQALTFEIELMTIER